MDLDKLLGNGTQSSQPHWLTLALPNHTLNYTLFTKGSRSSFLALLVYVDGKIITGPSTNLIQSLKSDLHRRFKLNDLGDLKYFLGLEISISSHGIFPSNVITPYICLKNLVLLRASQQICPWNPEINFPLMMETLLQTSLSVEDSLENFDISWHYQDQT